MLIVENLKIKKELNFTLQEEVFDIIADVNGLETVISSHETIEEAKAARIAIRSLMRIQESQVGLGS